MTDPLVIPPRFRGPPGSGNGGYVCGRIAAYVNGPAIAARCTAWYLSAMGEVYARSVPGQGCAAQVQAVIAANPRPSPQRGTVPPGAQAVLDQLAAYGTRHQVREQLLPWEQSANVVTILLPPGMPWHNIEATLRAAAPSAPPGCAQAASAPQRARPLLRGTALPQT